MYSKDELDRFQDAVQTMKLYRRAELQNGAGDDLIEELYVDPLPNEHVHSVLRRPNTTFLVGRKGTGKSTIFSRAQKSLLSEKSAMSTYVDIKTVFESARTDPQTLTNLARDQNAMTPESVETFLVMSSFLRAVVEGIRDDIRKQLKSSWKLRVKESFTGTLDDLLLDLDRYVKDISTPNFIDVQGVRRTQVKSGSNTAENSEINASLNISANPGLTVGSSTNIGVNRTNEVEYEDILLRNIDIKRLIGSLQALLKPLGIKHLFVFIDDFSELPEKAMKMIVETLIAPLNNWSDEMIKFKIAAYPGRIFYGQIDKSKIDEVDLDIYNLYGTTSVSDMEMKGVDFTRRLVETRLNYFGLEASKFFAVKRSPTEDNQVWTALFNACLGNPRALGYVLVFLYEDQLLYEKQITVSSIADAAKRYYEEKIESYFKIGRFLHESFNERSTIYSLKELLESIVYRARDLREKSKSSVFQRIDGRHPTSHFNVNHSFESILSTLELNFFVTKYYVMSDRTGNKVNVYALNYGLCVKHSIAFGRPKENRSQRLYFVERVFDYNPIIQSYIARNQEIRCDTCGKEYEVQHLDSLRMFNMLCPSCKEGTCQVSNISRRYADLLESVSDEQLLPPTELGILNALDSQGDGLYANDIAGELDVSYQLVGKRAKKLDEMRLLDRVSGRGGRREYVLTETARATYFSDDDPGALELENDPQQT